MPLSVTLTIGGTDVTAYVRIGSIVVHASLRDRSGTMSGLELVIPYSGSTPAVAVPRAGQEVILTVAGTREFGGVVQRVAETVAGSTSYAYVVDCTDYTRWFDRHLVQGVKYPAGEEEGVTGTAGSIITSLVSTYANQGALTWDVSLVEAGPVIPQQVFDFETPSACIDRVARIAGYRWDLDYDRKVVFTAISGTSAAAPVATVDWETQTGLSDLELSEVADQVVNVAYIRDTRSVVTDEDGDPIDLTQELGTANGYQTFWALGYEPANYASATVTVTPTSGPATSYTEANGGLLREGQDGTPGDGETVNKAYWCLPNWGVRLASAPPSGARVAATYQYLDIRPKATSVREGSSITEVRAREGSSVSDGVYEEVYDGSDLIDQSQDAIRARALLYLQQRAHKWSGSFRVFGTGWKPGQHFRFTSSRRFGGVFASGITLYTIDVQKRFATADEWVNEVAISSDVYGEL